MLQVWEWYFNMFRNLYAFCVSSYITSFWIVCALIILAINIYVRVNGNDK